ncbi:hypothetical protein Pan258_16730 [Symmachiella dynata]|uniref:DUF502 domain-containing protein n=1 Tax=Symmachiella dynata TaxID=2527995 RepID=UPI001189DEB0|nr:DUF502 domain-containing protein [Symmachiella dynata]QDT47637.1 hypothetical protein Pan258_16730 [Symmachiella dynata]
MTEDGARIKKKLPKGAATRVFLRGLSISLPPILTLVILLWVGQGLNTYIIQPIGDGVRWTIASTVNEIRQERELLPSEQLPPLPTIGNRYRITPGLQKRIPEIDKLIAEKRAASPAGKQVDQRHLWETIIREDTAQKDFAYNSDALSKNIYIPMGGGYIPLHVYATVERQVGPLAMPPTAIGAYMDYVTTQYFYSFWHLSALAILLTVVGVYFVGRLMTAQLGSWVVHKIETKILARLPLIRNVYSSVKQVTDFLLTETEVEYSRVVAIEYPRRGIWSLGLVTGESMLDIATAAGEPMISVLIPSSPMPVTGYTMNVPRSEVIDLDISVDEAFQFCISCGVLVPGRQQVTPEVLKKAFGKQLPSALPAISDSGTILTGPPKTE